MDDLIGGKKIKPLCVTSLIPGTDSGTCEGCGNLAATLVNGRCLNCVKPSKAGELNLLPKGGPCNGSSCQIEYD